MGEWSPAARLAYCAALLGPLASKPGKMGKYDGAARIMRALRLHNWVALSLLAAGWIITGLVRPAEPLNADLSLSAHEQAQPLPSVILSTHILAAGAHRRWLRILERRPEMAGFDAGIVKTPIWGQVPVHSLVLVAANRAELIHACAGLRDSGYPCQHSSLDPASPFELLAMRDASFSSLVPPEPEVVVEPVIVVEVEVEIIETADTYEAPWVWLDPAAETDPSVLRVIGVGDIMMGTDYPNVAWHNSNIQQGTSADELLSPELLSLLRGADVAFGNHEGVLAGRHLPSAKDCSNCFSFRSPTYHADVLADAGFDLISMANNHSGDFGEAGRMSSIHALQEAGLGIAGLDRDGARTATQILENGVRVGLIAFAPNIATLDLRDVRGAAARVAELAETHDIVIVSFHGGAEGNNATRVPFATETYYGENRGDVRVFARAMVDAGADIIFGHGPHVPRGVETYRERFITYSLGNFWTYTGFTNWGLLGLGPMVEVAVYPDGRVGGVAIHSTRQAGYGVPQMDEMQEARRMVLDLTRRDFPATYERLTGATTPGS